MKAKIRSHLGLIGYTFLAAVAALSLRVGIGEVSDRQVAVCHAQNVVKSEIVAYLHDLATGQSTAAAPIPADLPPEMRAFVTAARTASRAYSAHAERQAKVRFAIARCPT